MIPKAGDGDAAELFEPPATPAGRRRRYWSTPGLGRCGPDVQESSRAARFELGSWGGSQSDDYDQEHERHLGSQAYQGPRNKPAQTSVGPQSR